MLATKAERIRPFRVDAPTQARVPSVRMHHQHAPDVPSLLPPRANLRAPAGTCAQAGGRLQSHPKAGRGSLPLARAVAAGLARGARGHPPPSPFARRPSKARTDPPRCSPPRHSSSRVRVAEQVISNHPAAIKTPLDTGYWLGTFSRLTYTKQVMPSPPVVRKPCNLATGWILTRPCPHHSDTLRKEQST